MKHSNLAKIFKALANEQRLKLFQMIHDNTEDLKLDGDISLQKSCCSGMEKAFTKASEILNISRSTVSHHLKELQNAGLINCERNGQTIICSVNENTLQQMKTF